MVMLTSLVSLAPSSLATAQDDDPSSEAQQPSDSVSDEVSSDEVSADASDGAASDEDAGGASEEAASDLAEASSEGLDDLESLLGESVVTTASRSAERASAAPSTVFTITAREMHIFGIRTLDEALAYLGVGFQVARPRDYYAGVDIGASGVMLRDLGRHVLVLLDGHVMNSQANGELQLHEGVGVPLEAIDHLEVILGPGSVMYGSNAMLAVVNIVTRRARDGRGVRAIAELGLAAPMGTDGQPTGLGAGDRAGIRYRFGAAGATTFDFLGSAGELVVHAEWIEEISQTYAIPPLVTDIQQRYAHQEYWGGLASHGMRAPSVFATLRLGDFRLMFQANHYYRDIPLVGTFNDPLSNESRTHVRAELRHSAALSPHVSLVTRMYTDFMGFEEHTVWTDAFWCAPGQIDGCRFGIRTNGRWAGLEQQLSIDWNLDGRLATSIGYDVRGRDAVGRTGDLVDVVTGELPHTIRLPYFHDVSFLGAVFAQQVWQPFDWLTFNAGARLDVDSLFGARVSPRFAATVLPVQGTSVRASYSEAFRAPSSYELREHDVIFRLPPPTLRPEVVRSVDIEWQQRIAFITFSLRAFAAFYEDFIDTREATQEEFDRGYAAGQLASTAEFGSIVRYDNLETMRALGGSLAFTMRPATGLTIAGSISVVDSRIGDDPSPLVPNWLGNARIAYEFAPGGAAITAAAVFVGSRTAFIDADIDLLGPGVIGEQLDLRATFSAPIEWVPGLRFRTSFAYTVNPFQAYLLSAPTVGVPDAQTYFFPVPASLTGFLGLQYDVDP